MFIKKLWGLGIETGVFESGCSLSVKCIFRCQMWVLLLNKFIYSWSQFAVLRRKCDPRIKSGSLQRAKYALCSINFVTDRMLLYSLHFFEPISIHWHIELRCGVAWNKVWNPKCAFFKTLCPPPSLAMGGKFKVCLHRYSFSGMSTRQNNNWINARFENKFQLFYRNIFYWQ